MLINTTFYWRKPVVTCCGKRVRVGLVQPLKDLPPMPQIRASKVDAWTTHELLAQCLTRALFQAMHKHSTCESDLRTMQKYGVIKTVEQWGAPPLPPASWHEMVASLHTLIDPSPTPRKQATSECSTESGRMPTDIILLDRFAESTPQHGIRPAGVLQSILDDHFRHQDREGVDSILTTGGPDTDPACCLVDMSSESCRALRETDLSTWFKSLFHFIHERSYKTAQRHTSHIRNVECSTFDTQVTQPSRIDEGFQVELSQFDLFHAHAVLLPWTAEIMTTWVPSDYGMPIYKLDGQQDHVFSQPVAKGACPDDDGGGGMCLLFHAKEYPQYDSQNFPYQLGYCQKGSNVHAEDASFNGRNILWYRGELYIMDMSPGGLLHGQLLQPDLEPLRTLQESALGLPLFDITYLPHWEQPYITLRESITKHQ